MAKYGINLTCIYNGYVEVEAKNESEAMQIANEMVTDDVVNKFPSEVETPIDIFSFGELTVDYADELEN